MSSRCWGSTRCASARCSGRSRHGRAVPRLPGARNRGKAIAVDPDLPASFYAAIGRRVIAGLALRPDRLERLAAAARGRRAPRPL